MVSGPCILDTNVLIYALSGTKQSAMQVIDACRPEGITISVITEIELLSGIPPGQEKATRILLEACNVFPVNRVVAEFAAKARITHRLKTPDAIVYATAETTNRTLVTYNTRDSR